MLFGLLLMLAGVFPEDYLSQLPHNLVSASAFLVIIAAQLLVWKGLKMQILLYGADTGPIAW